MFSEVGQLSQIRPARPSTHRYHVRVKFSDTDTTGRVYFTSYVRWIDEAIIEFLRSRGITYRKPSVMLVKGKPVEDSFVIGEYHCRIEEPSAYDDELEVNVHPESIRERTVRFAASINLKGVEERVLATGWLTYVYVDNGTGKSKKIPADIVRML